MRLGSKTDLIDFGETTDRIGVMKSSFSLVRATVFALFLAAPALPAAQQLVYEREYSLMPGDSNLLSMTLEPDGTMVVERPAMMTNSGVITGNVPARHYERLRTALDTIRVTTTDLESDLRQRSRVEFFHVSDVETSRFYALDANRSVAASIEVDSLQPRAQHFDDDMRLHALRDLERQWWQLMEQIMTDTGGPE